MKKCVISLVISILIISSVSLVSAESNETEINNQTETDNEIVGLVNNESNETVGFNETEIDDTIPKAGITPGSIFYGFDVFFDNVRVALTFRQVNKAKLRLDIMGERMAEMEEMASKNKTAEAEKAESQVQKQMQKFDSAVEKVKIKDIEELNEHMQNYNARLEEQKQRLVDWGEPDYADAIAEAIEMLEELENAIISLPDDLDPELTFKISLLCQAEGATTAEECEEMVAGGLLIIQYGIAPEIDRTLECNYNIQYGDMYSDGTTRWCCKDSDGDMPWAEGIGTEHFYKKGTVGYKIINLETKEIEEETETDSCDGDTLTEWFCPTTLDSTTRNERYSEEYDCPNGCEDGACITRHLSATEEFEAECIDSDGGQDYFTKGVTNNNVEDYCNDDSWLIEYFCEDNNVVSSIPYSCPSGCEDGVCISS